MLSNKLPCVTNQENLSYSDNKMYDCCPLFQEEVYEDHPNKNNLTSLTEIVQRVLPDLPPDIERNGDNKEEVTTRKIL